MFKPLLNLTNFPSDNWNTVVHVSALCAADITVVPSGTATTDLSTSVKNNRSITHNEVEKL
jgi:hypothetical protein